MWTGPGIVDVARASGRDPQRKGSRLTVRCPNPLHPDNHPSCDIDDEANVFCCRSCGAGGGVVDFANLVGVRLKDLSTAGPSLVRAPPPTKPPRRDAPAFPVPEAEALWKRSRRVLDDSEVAAYLKGRGVDPADVELHNLVRALPPDSYVPRWAYSNKSYWPATGHRALLAMYNASGAFAGIRGRRILTAADGFPKSLTPCGLSLKGLVLANSLGRLLLQGGSLADGTPAADLVRRVSVIISEGDIDFLACATEAADSDDLAPAVLGIGNGWWTDQIASRIPDGTTVAIRSQGDPRGNEYSRLIGRSLFKRCNVIVLETTQ